MNIECPSCKFAMEVADDRAGKLVRCGGCKQNFVVPVPQGDHLTLENEDLIIDHDPALDEKPPPPPDPNTLMFCPHCGAKWKRGKVECKECHFNIQINAVLRAPDKLGRNRFFDMQKIFLYIFILAMLYGIYWLLFQPVQDGEITYRGGYDWLMGRANQVYDNATKEKKDEAQSTGGQ